MASKKVRMHWVKPLSYKAADNGDYGFRMSDSMRNYMIKHKEKDYENVQKLAPDVQAALEPRLRKQYAQEEGFAEKYSPLTTPASAKSFMMPDARPKHDRMDAFTPLVGDYYEKGEAWKEGRAKARDAKGAKDAKGTDSKKKSYTKEKAAKHEDWTAPDGWAKVDAKAWQAADAHGVMGRTQTGWNHEDLDDFMGKSRQNNLYITTFGKWNGRKEWIAQLMKEGRTEEEAKAVMAKAGVTDKTPVHVKNSDKIPLRGYQVLQLQITKEESSISFRHYGQFPKQKDKPKDTGGAKGKPEQKDKQGMKGWTKGMGVKIQGTTGGRYVLMPESGKESDGETLTYKTLDQALNRARRIPDAEGRKITYSNKVKEAMKEPSGEPKQKSKEKQKEAKHQSDFEKKYSNKDVEY